MQKSISKLVVVGNGFDLHHGLETGYSDFVKKGMLRKSLLQLESYAAEAGYNVPKKEWYNFEELYRRIILQKQNAMLNSGGLGDAKSRKLFAEEMQSVNHFFHGLMHEIQKYLQNVIHEQAAESKNPNYRIDGNAKDCLESADCILTLNYTDTLERLYGIDSKKIIHVHGKLEDFPIFGHANYIRHGEWGTDYGFSNIAQGMAEVIDSGNIMSVNAKTGKITEANMIPKKVTKIANIENMMFGDKNIQRVIMLSVIQQMTNATDLLTSNVLSWIYRSPFSEYPKKLGIKNYLELDFSDEMTVAIIGHGLKSDVDLLSKISSERKQIFLFNGPDYVDNELTFEASRVFNTDSEKIHTVEYSW